jgi:hypothetical protein
VSDRRLTDDERERLRAAVLAAIDGEQHRGRRRRRLGAGAAALCVLAALVAGSALRPSDDLPSGVAGAIPVRCGAADDVADATVTARAGHDPRLVCSELWRRSELVGGRRMASELSACPQLGDQGVLVLVTAAPGTACRHAGA